LGAVLLIGPYLLCEKEAAMSTTHTLIGFDTKRAQSRYKAFTKSGLVAAFAIENNTDWFKGVQELQQAGFLGGEDYRARFIPESLGIAPVKKAVFGRDIRKFTKLNRLVVEKGYVALPAHSRKAAESQYITLNNYLMVDAGEDEVARLKNTGTYFTGMAALSEHIALKLKEKDPKDKLGDQLLMCAAAGCEHWMKQVENRKVFEAKRQRAASKQRVH
jgi:hypothetical protein